jgi:hypothetical protein
MMTGTVLEHPAAPAELGNTYGGFADIARRLSALHPERERPISRQLVQRWYVCRGKNGFPDRELIEVGDGKVKHLFNLAAVERWHSNDHRPRKLQAGPPPIETIPLFSVDNRGSMIA